MAKEIEARTEVMSVVYNTGKVLQVPPTTKKVIDCLPNRLCHFLSYINISFFVCVPHLLYMYYLRTLNLLHVYMYCSYVQHLAIAVLLPAMKSSI